MKGLVIGIVVVSTVEMMVHGNGSMTVWTINVVVPIVKYEKLQY